MKTPREILKQLTREGSVPKGMKVRIRSKMKTLQVLGVGDLTDKFGEDIALLSIGVSVRALERKLPGWRVSVGGDLELLWEQRKAHLGSVPMTGDKRLDYRNHVVPYLSRYRNVYEYARYIQCVHKGEDALAGDEARVPVLSEPPITPKMDRKMWTHFMPYSTYEDAVAGHTVVLQSPEAIVSYHGKYYYPRV